MWGSLKVMRLLFGNPPSRHALWSVGAAPHYRRSDSISAAFRNLDDDTRADPTTCYEALCAHFQ